LPQTEYFSAEKFLLPRLDGSGKLLLMESWLLVDTIQNPSAVRKKPDGTHQAFSIVEVLIHLITATRV
jgi:hypothetical protein